MTSLHVVLVRLVNRRGAGTAPAVPQRPAAEDVWAGGAGQPRVALLWHIGADGRLGAEWTVATRAVGPAVQGAAA